MDYFTADTHFGHANLARRRGFERPIDMDEALVAAWNDKVTNADRVFILGDFSFSKMIHTVELTSRLRGQLFLVRGNHDSRKEANANPYFAWVRDYECIKAEDGTTLSLSHFPMLVWNKSHYGAWHLHGHSHGNLRLPPGMEKARIFDVGVDSVHKRTGSWAPVTFNEIKELRGEVEDVSFDHH